MMALRSLAACAAALAVTFAQAQEFPSKPIRVFVPFAAGSTTDLIARVVTTAMSEQMKTPVIVENRTGAGGIVSLAALLRSPPDGYTLGLIVVGNNIQTWVVKDMPFDVRKDFAPITDLYAGYFVLLVGRDFPAQTLPAFVAYAKANPGKLFFGSSGTATVTHLAGEVLKAEAGIDMTHVPFKGAPEVYTAAMNGSIQAYFDLYGTSKPLIESGKVRPLAVTSAKRLAELPQVPALAETYPGVDVAARVGLAAPLGTPQPVLDRLTAEARAALQSPDVRKRILGFGQEPGGSPPAEYARNIAADTEKWGKAARAAGLKPE